VPSAGIPGWSVIIPAYNEARRLPAYLDEVVAYFEGLDRSYEVLVVDGGSTDGSVEIIKRYERHLAYWVSEPDAGQSNAINKGLNRATGTILTWLNSDDYYTPGALEIVATAALAHPEAGAQGGGDLRQPLARVDLEPVRLLEPQQQPQLVEGEQRQVGTGNEHGGADDPVLPGERGDELLGGRAA